MGVCVPWSQRSGQQDDLYGLEKAPKCTRSDQSSLDDQKFRERYFGQRNLKQISLEYEKVHCKFNFWLKFKFEFIH